MPVVRGRVVQRRRQRRRRTGDRRQPGVRGAATRRIRIPSGARSISGGARTSHRHRRRHSAEGRMGQFRAGRRDAGQLCSGGADQRSFPPDGAHVVLAELVRAACADRRTGHRWRDAACRGERRSVAAVREVPDRGRPAPRGGRDASARRRCCWPRSPDWRCCWRRSVFTVWSQTASPSGRANWASVSRSARRFDKRWSRLPSRG